MSDSDETDILLLIPPDFFNCESPVAETLRRTTANNCSFGSVDCLSYESFAHRNSTLSMAGIGSYSMNGCSAAERTEQYVASTPFKRHPGHPEPHKEQQYILHEIDQYLQEGDHKQPQQHHPLHHQHNGVHSPDGSLLDINGLSMHDYPSLTGNDFHGLVKPAPPCGPVPQKPPRNVQNAASTKPASKNGNLLNLSDIWYTNGAPGQPEYSKALQEERLRRQHCERNIQSLQMKLLEYEEKISVALSVDKEKVTIIGNLEQETTRLTSRIRDMELKHIETHEKLMAENLEVKNKNLFLEKEITETLNLVRKLEAKNEALETKVETLASANRDVNEVHKRQLEDLQIRLANSRDNERQLREQLGKLRKANDQLGADLESERKKLADGVRLRADFCALKTKTDSLGKRFTEVTRENESLREQTKHMKEQILVHQEESKKLLKELEIQRVSLKKYYQSQLEDVVSDKLKEFQKQLTTVEAELKDESQKKERSLTDRAKRQIELIDHKREQEIQLLTERYNEQESLYRLQLANSAKRIHELEEKLHTIQHRRADIAEQLHRIMENQWKQALDVLMSPGQRGQENNSSKLSDLEAKSKQFNRFALSQLDKDRLDGVRSLKTSVLTDESDSFRTPVPQTTAERRSTDAGHVPTFPKELLHNYIELLLEKSPNDLKRLEEVLSSCRKQTTREGTTRDVAGTMSKSASATALNQLGGKPCSGKTPRPWK
ncbi:rho-associated protein kinase 1 [Anopheles ziemanni]|uniref:rho-associated protein kinase 1 n=1 Tax=Anopheles coustani TaxID=139045 RepID=UPI002659EC5E|nr:rho-associated protein kinase 1 [Anopheles coustani]XP_058171828.1 rho-associated protein kinase 1 [Anopheles ziemanni]